MTTILLATLSGFVSGALAVGAAWAAKTEGRVDVMQRWGRLAQQLGKR